MKPNVEEVLNWKGRGKGEGGRGKGGENKETISPLKICCRIKKARESQFWHVVSNKANSLQTSLFLCLGLVQLRKRFWMEINREAYIPGGLTVELKKAFQNEI